MHRLSLPANLHCIALTVSALAWTTLGVMKFAKPSPVRIGVLRLPEPAGALFAALEVSLGALLLWRPTRIHALGAAIVFLLAAAAATIMYPQQACGCLGRVPLGRNGHITLIGFLLIANGTTLLTLHRTQRRVRSA